MYTKKCCIKIGKSEDIHIYLKKKDVFQILLKCFVFYIHSYAIDRCVHT